MLPAVSQQPTQLGALAQPASVARTRLPLTSVPTAQATPGPRLTMDGTSPSISRSVASQRLPVGYNRSYHHEETVTGGSRGPKTAPRNVAVRWSPPSAAG